MPATTERIAISIDREVLAQIDARGSNRSRTISQDLGKLYMLAALYDDMPAAIRLLLDGMGLGPAKKPTRVSPGPRRPRA